MKTRVSKLLAMSFMGLTASISFMGYNIWSQPRLEPEDRPSLPWNPQTKFGDSIPRPTAVPDQVGKVFARPLFSPSRKPFVAAEAAAEEVQTEPEAQPAAVSEPGFDPAQFV